MGKGPRGEQQETIKKYGDPGYQATTDMSGQSGRLMYGQPTQQPTQQPTGIASTSTPTQNPWDTGYQYGGGEGSPDQYGFYEQSSKSGQLTGKDRVHEVYRWGVQSGQSPEAMLAKGGMTSGDRAYLQQLIQQGGGTDSVAFQGWQPRPNNVSSTAQKRGDQWVDPVSGQTWSGAGQPMSGGGAAPGQFGAGGAAGQAIGDYGNIAGQYQQFANTGGYSPEDLSNMRARAVSPIRSAYSSARRGVDRQRALQGGYSPNRTAALAKMAREQSYATSDASTNVEAAIAQMVQQGKLAGLGGMAGMYGTTPGLANMFGQQALASQGMQNQMGLGMIGANQAAMGMPTGFQNVMGNVSRGAQMAAPFMPGGQFTNPFSSGGQ